jgi:hypothetical protein
MKTATTEKLRDRRSYILIEASLAGKLEVPLALFMPTVAVQLDSLTGAFA